MLILFTLTPTTVVGKGELLSSPGAASRWHQHRALGPPRSQSAPFARPHGLPACSRALQTALKTHPCWFRWWRSTAQSRRRPDSQHLDVILWRHQDYAHTSAYGRVQPQNDTDGGPFPRCEKGKGAVKEPRPSVSFLSHTHFSFLNFIYTPEY